MITCLNITEPLSGCKFPNAVSPCVSVWTGNTLLTASSGLQPRRGPCGVRARSRAALTQGGPEERPGEATRVLKEALSEGARGSNPTPHVRECGAFLMHSLLGQCRKAGSFWIFLGIQKANVWVSSRGGHTPKHLH